VTRADDPLLVHEKRGAALQSPEVVPDPVEAPDLPVGGEVAQEPEGQLEILRPGSVPLGEIRGDAHDLHILLVELRLFIPEPGELANSAGREGLDIKGQDDVPARGEEIRQAHGLAALIRQGEIRGFVANTQRSVSRATGSDAARKTDVRPSRASRLTSLRR